MTIKPKKGDPDVPEDKDRGTEKSKIRGKSVLLRQRKIVDLVKSLGFVSIESLSTNFSVTPQTIRRDINELTQAGQLQRHHGGAGLPSSVKNVAYTTRKVMCMPEKRRIAHLLARHIPDNASLFIDIGTTTEEVANALIRHQGLRVITNNLNVASILSENENFEVIVAGGVVRSRDRGITGKATVDFIRQFKIDFGIISVSGIDTEGCLLDFDYQEVGVGQTIISNSRKVYLAADHTKFGREAMVRLCNLRDIDALFTDQRPEEKICQMLSDAHIPLHVGGTPGKKCPESLCFYCSFP